MRVFHVEVDCWHDLKGQRIREKRDLFIEAENVTEARTKGLELAERTAACSEKLVGVEWRRTAPVDFPIELRDGVLTIPNCFRNLRLPRKLRRAA